MFTFAPAYAEADWSGEYRYLDTFGLSEHPGSRILCRRNYVWPFGDGIKSCKSVH